MKRRPDNARRPTAHSVYTRHCPESRSFSEHRSGTLEARPSLAENVLPRVRAPGGNRRGAVLQAPIEHFLAAVANCTKKKSHAANKPSTTGEEPGFAAVKKYGWIIKITNETHKPTGHTMRARASKAYGHVGV
ncbi:hypothetical protein MTO96_009886 [Rhipicephalus appendiculatus]